MGSCGTDSAGKLRPVYFEKQSMHDGDYNRICSYYDCTCMDAVKKICQTDSSGLSGQESGDGKYSFSELEELYRWLAERGKTPEAGELPPNMADLFEHFAQNVKTLTNAEYNILRYYMNGYEVSQIPTAACISMSTVKKHNGNIYRKLEISSNEELMMYLDLFRRCDLIEKLQLDVKTDISEAETDK